MDEYSFLIRCDGSYELGLGHVFRCLALAEGIKLSLNAKVLFAVWEEKSAADLLRAKGEQVVNNDIYTGRRTSSEWLKSIIEKASFDAIFVDVAREGDEDALIAAKEMGIIIAGIDDFSHRSSLFDVNFVPPVPQIKSIGLCTTGSKLLCGWDWIVINPVFSRHKKGSTDTYTRDSTLRLLVTMGGSDPFRLTEKVLDSLCLVNTTLNVRVVVGSGFRNKEVIYEKCKQLNHRVEVLEAVETMAEIMSTCDLAVASFGTTAYELACIGVPAAYLAITEDHALSASALEKTGVCKSLGVYWEVSSYRLAAEIDTLAKDTTLRERMQLNGCKLIDGKGAFRIGKRVVDEIEERRKSYDQHE